MSSKFKSFFLGLKHPAAIPKASGPDSLITAIAAIPGAVAGAQIVSFMPYPSINPSFLKEYYKYKPISTPLINSEIKNPCQPAGWVNHYSEIKTKT
jgi:hypothetical protein